MEPEKKYAETYGGKLGGALPLIGMILAIVVLSLNGMNSLRNFWGAGFAALAIGFFVYKDKGLYAKAAMRGFANRTFTVLFSIFIMAGILSKILTASHLADGLIYIVSLAKIPPAVIPCVTFLLGALLSTVTGSSFTALLSIIPILFPIGVQMGCSAGLVLGAICSGAEFGNYLSPISDVTIAAALAQDVEVAATLKTRIRYTLAAGIPATILFLVVGFATTKGMEAATMSAESTNLTGLLFILIPVLIAVMVLRKASFMVALVAGDLLGFVMLLVLGYTDLNGIFASDGLIANGIDSMLNVLVFMGLIFVMMALIEDAGVLASFQSFIVKHAKSPKMAEIFSGVSTCVICAAIGNGMSTLAFMGPVVRNIVEPFKIVRTRAANYVSGFTCGISWLMPHGLNPLTALSAALGTGVVAESFSLIEFLPYNFFCLALIIVYWIVILTGIGRKTEDAAIAQQKY